MFTRLGWTQFWYQLRGTIKLADALAAFRIDAAGAVALGLG